MVHHLDRPVLTGLVGVRARARLEESGHPSVPPGRERRHSAGHQYVRTSSGVIDVRALTMAPQPM